MKITISTLLESLNHLSKIVDGEVPSADSVDIENTFRIIHTYLSDLHTRGGGWEDPDVQRGMQSIMLLAAEAAHALDRHGALSSTVADMEEYKKLQNFYVTGLAQRLKEEIDEQEPVESQGAEKPLEKIRDVRADRSYELFYIKNEKGGAYFRKDLAKHVRLLGDFEEVVIAMGAEDPLTRLNVLVDRDIHQAAQEILHLAKAHIDAFYRVAMASKQTHECVSALNKALMALMLSANPMNLAQNTSGKNCTDYYADFHLYLRLALLSKEYKVALTSSLKKGDSFSHVLLSLSHALCCFFFTRVSTHQEAVAWIHRMLQKDPDMQMWTSASHCIWDRIEKEDASMQKLLEQYPNVPILKTAEMFNNKEQLTGFDPLSKGSFPCQLFDFKYHGMDISCIRLPSPTYQLSIDEGHIVEEFHGLLRYFETQSIPKRHLCIHLEDRLSWREHTRSILIENLSTVYPETFYVITLPRSTPFYLHSEEYAQVHDASMFMQQLIDQVTSEEVCGFYFSKNINKKSMFAYAKSIVHGIHDAVFNGKKVLTPHNRSDFIEIFYLLLTLNAIDLVKPDVLSFSCKDGIDTASVSAATLYAVLKILRDKEAIAWSEEERDMMLWLLHIPALSERGRTVNTQDLHGQIHALSALESAMSADGKAFFNTLFPEETAPKKKKKNLSK